MGPGPVARVLELPMLRSVLPGAILVIFAICLSSFAVALTLGGGPRATTVELAIYQAFRFDFDLGRAAVLASVQVGLVGLAAVLAQRLAAVDGLGAGLDRMVMRWDVGAWRLRVVDGLWLGLVVAFLLVPMAMIVLRGFAALPDLPGSVWRAAGVSVGVALGSTLISVALGLAMGLSRRGWVHMAALLGMAVSPLVVGTGLFIMINPFASPAALALPITALVNAVMALPFVLRILAPELARIERDFGRLADSLGMVGAARLRWLILPRARRALGFAAGLAAALSMGDLGVIALFADPERATLPLQILRLMGSYQMSAAAGAGLLLLGLSLTLFWLFDRGGHGDADA
jgi:thiamine transport system permease protein